MLRTEEVRANIRIRFCLIPCVYIGIIALSAALCTGHLTDAQLKIACTAIAILIVALLRDRFGLSMRVQLRRHFWLLLQRALKWRSTRREFESLLKRLPQDAKRDRS